MSTDTPFSKLEGNKDPTPQQIEQYKAKVSDLGNLGARYTSMTTCYVSIVSAILGILALKERAITDIATSVFLAVCGAGFAVSLLWFLNLSFFRTLFRVKLEVLSQLEQTLPYRTYQVEWELLKKSRIRSWIAIERFVPVAFAVFFVALAFVRLAKFLP